MSSPNPTIEEKLKDLEDKVQEMEHFTFRAAHDLKRPLVTIESFVEILRADIDAQAYDRIREDVTEIALAADRMRELISELLELARVGRLDLTKIGADSMEVVPCALGDVLESILRVSETIDSSTEFDIQRPLPTVLARPTQLRELFENLIVNAHAHNPDSQELKIQISTEDCGAYWQVNFSDNGVGISPAGRDHVFEWFVQLHETGVGTGMGLAICKRIVELHQGKIWIEDRAGVPGCHICFTLRKG